MRKLFQKKDKCDELTEKLKTFLSGMRNDELVSLTILLAGTVLPIYETEHPNDDRPRHAIEEAGSDSTNKYLLDNAMCAAYSAYNYGEKPVNGLAGSKSGRYAAWAASMAASAKSGDINNDHDGVVFASSRALACAVLAR